MTSLQVKVHSERGECFGLYRYVLIIFRHEYNHNSSKLSQISYFRLKEIKGATILCKLLINSFNISGHIEHLIC